MKTKEIVNISNIFEQFYLFKIKGIYLAKLCGTLETAKDAIKNAVFEEIKDAAEKDHQETCSMLWKGSQEINCRTGKIGWIPCVNNNNVYNAPSENSLYFLDGGVAIDTRYSINGGDKNNIPETKSSIVYHFKPWYREHFEFIIAANLLDTLRNTDKTLFNYKSKKTVFDSFFEMNEDILSFVNYLYLSNFNKKACERFYIFRAIETIKNEINQEDKQLYDLNKNLLKNLAEIKTNINKSIYGLTEICFDKLNIFVELEKFNKLIKATEINTPGLSTLGAIFKTNGEVFNIQLFSNVKNENILDEGMVLEKKIYDYYERFSNTNVENNYELYKKFVSLNKESDKFIGFILGILKRYKTLIAVELM